MVLCALAGSTGARYSAIFTALYEPSSSQVKCPVNLTGRNTDTLWGTYRVGAIFLSTFCVWSHILLPTALWSSYFYTHFTDDEHKLGVH